MIGRRSVVGAVAAVGIMACSVLGGTDAASAVANECEPEILDMGTLAGHESGQITAMNDRGWAVGASSKSSFARHAPTATLWRDGDVIDLGFRRGPRVPSYVSVTSFAEDVNENGLIAVNRDRLNPRTDLDRRKASLWLRGERTRLPAGKTRRSASVNAVNDKGRAVGYIAVYGHDNVAGGAKPVMWHDGELIKLPRPRGTVGWASAINNNGLIVGAVSRNGVHGGWYEPWFWRVNGAHGPLSIGGNLRGYWDEAVDVDDQGRILGELGERVALWSSPRAGVVVASSPPDVSIASAMNNHGDIVGTHLSPVYAAYVSRALDEPSTLPSPYTMEGYFTSSAKDVTRAVTNFAPQGGVSVAGSAANESGQERPTIWTCAFRQPESS